MTSEFVAPPCTKFPRLLRPASAGTSPEFCEDRFPPWCRDSSTTSVAAVSGKSSRRLNRKTSVPELQPSCAVESKNDIAHEQKQGLKRAITQEGASADDVRGHCKRLHPTLPGC